MRILYDILPTFLFFFVFKFYGIYAATWAGIGITLAQVAISRLWFKKWDRAQLITLVVFSFFGGMTLYFHNPIFVKWKPTIIFWIFALCFLGSTLTQQPLIQRLMQRMMADAIIPHLVWKRLNLFWASFFMLLGGINLYIAYYWSNEAWVNFKFYGITGALFGVSFLQAIYLSQYMKAIPIKEKASKAVD
jgi:intracellular septation protein